MTTGRGALKNAPVTDIFGLYTPPFRLVSEMLIVAALCPAAPLKETFSGVPFLSLAGRTLLLFWFATVQEIHYSRYGRPARLGALAAPLYREMTAVALLRQRGFFVPVVYADDTLTLQVGWRYGMPKEKRELSLSVRGRKVTASVTGERSDIRVDFRARRRLDGAARWLERRFPMRVWPARFPSGETIRPRLTETPVIVAGRVRGELKVETAWLPVPVRLLPWGLYLPRQVMTMPQD